MGRLLILLISLYIAYYCISFSKTVYKEGNKAGAIGTAILALVAIASPFIFFFT